MVFLLRRCGQHTLFSFSWPGARPNSTVWNGLYYTIRQPPFTTAELVDMDYKVDFSTVTTQDDRVAVIATKPLTKNALNQTQSFVFVMTLEHPHAGTSTKNTLDQTQ